jgi:hypothetical protein
MATDDFSDELFELMTTSGERTPASQQLRDAVIGQTTGTIRRRRRTRRASIAATLVACYLGGIATMSLWQSSRAVDRFVDGSAVAMDQNSEGVAGSETRRLVRPEDDQVPDGGASLAAARLTPYERLCRDGDQQLEEHDDIQAAMRSYKKALQLASADQRSVAPDHDTWLLMAMKQSIN